MNEQASLTRSGSDEADHSNPIVLAWLVSVAIVLALAVLVFWPARTWTAPARPKLATPIVFDEFVNTPSAAPTPAASGQSVN